MINYHPVVKAKALLRGKLNLLSLTYAKASAFAKAMVDKL